jgi:hypothetical protein
LWPLLLTCRAERAGRRRSQLVAGAPFRAPPTPPGRRPLPHPSFPDSSWPFVGRGSQAEESQGAAGALKMGQVHLYADRELTREQSTGVYGVEEEEGVARANSADWIEGRQGG